MIYCGSADVNYLKLSPHTLSLTLHQISAFPALAHSFCYVIPSAASIASSSSTAPPHSPSLFHAARRRPNPPGGEVGSRGLSMRLWYSAGGAYPTSNAVMAALAAGRLPPPNVSRAELGLFEAPTCARILTSKPTSLSNVRARDCAHVCGAHARCMR